MGSDVAFNINDFVRVRLTDRGRLHCRRRYDSLRRQYPSLPKYQAPKTDERGYSRWQLWDLMETFGAAIQHGAEPPFETEIYFETASPALPAQPRGT
jgi:hypothetical protein